MSTWHQEHREELNRSRRERRAIARNGNPSRRHGLSGTQAYKSWRAMVARCTNSGHNMWKHYGGRGIKVCDRWSYFPNFFADMGERPDGATLDRIDPNKGYEPSNCRWVTQKEQRLNQRRTVLYTYNGLTLCLSDWIRTITGRDDVFSLMRNAIPKRRG